MPMLVLLIAVLCLISPTASFATSTSDDQKTAITTGVIQLTPGQSAVVSLVDYKVTTLTVAGVSPTSSYIIIQVHAQHAILELTQTSPVAGGKERGGSVGMVQRVDRGPMSWTVRVVQGSVGSEDFPVRVLATVQEYAESAPVPGGCNQVFALEEDPNIRVTRAEYHSQVWFQWANIGSRAGESPPGCESKADWGRLQYEVYVAYTGEMDDRVDALFSTLRSLMTVKSMRKNARKVSTLKNDNAHKSVVKVTSQRGQGSVYGVIVTDTQLGVSASYVSAVSYACNYTAGECSLQYEAVEWVMLVACGVAGLILVILGHQFFRTEMVVFGFIATALVISILLSMAHSLTDAERLGIACGLGVVGGGVWLLVWVAFTFPSISVLLPGLCAGFLVAGAVFFTPFANISWWASNLNYGLVFTCVTFLFGVVFLCSPRTLSIVSCAVAGGYCVMLVVGIPLRSCLRLIVLNVLRHAQVPDYATIITIAPFSVNDIILTLMWIVVTAASICWQFYRARGKPHFPDQRRRLRRRVHQQGQREEGRGQGHPPPSYVSDERTPLLGNQPARRTDNGSMDRVPAVSEINRPM